MGVRITRTVVCDLGERHGGEIEKYAVTVAGVTRKFDLCRTCSKPLRDLFARGAGGTRPRPGRVWTLDEIEESKKTPS